MTPVAPETRRKRVARVQADVRAADLDTLVVTHPPNIEYLTGFSGTAGAVLLSPSGMVLAVDFRYRTAADALAATMPDGLLTTAPVEHSYDQAIAGLLHRAGAKKAGIEAAHLPVARFNAIAAQLVATAPTSLQSGNPMPVLVPTERVIERARMVKDDGEVATLREGGRRLSAIAHRLREFAVPGQTELEVAARIDQALREAGFSRPAFDTIVASGPNSAYPHARPTDRVLQAGDPTVLDFGGVYGGYCVDLTRTVQLGSETPAVRALFDAVLEAQTAALQAIRPGIRGSEVDAAARGVLEQHGLGAAFGHGTGHGLGLEVHEEPRVSRLVAGLPDEPLVTGMVFTVEPGAYVPGTGGVRIEDDVLVTSDGCELLTDAPRRLT